MARSLFNAKALHVYVLDTFSFSVNRRRSRGYAVRGLLAKLGDQEDEGTGSSSKTQQQQQQQVQIMREEPPVIRDESGAASWWVPDPITGFYKPSHHLNHIDAAQLRAMHGLHPQDVQGSHKHKLKLKIN